MTIYFIGAALGSRLQAVKIGQTKQLSKRVAALQGSNYSSLQILAYIDGDTLLERHLHEEFRGVRLQGEWFQPDPALLWRIHEIRRGEWVPPSVIEPQKRLKSSRVQTTIASPKMWEQFLPKPPTPVLGDDKAELEEDWKLVRPSFTGGQGHTRQLAGKFFGYLEVVKREGSDKNGMSLWACVCRLCGNPKIVSRAALLSGRVKSCGCLKASLKGKPKPQPQPLLRHKKSAWNRILDDEG